MTIKIFEIRDRMTFIPIICFCPNETDSNNDAEKYLLAKMGIVKYDSILPVIMYSPSKRKCCLYAMEWNDRTYQNAHRYIDDKWTELESGSVIDVEFILGETSSQKKSQRFD